MGRDLLTAFVPLSTTICALALNSFMALILTQKRTVSETDIDAC